MSTAIENSFLTTEQVAERLRLTVATVVKMIRSGYLPGYQVGRQYRVLLAEFEEWFATKRVKSRSEEPAA